MSSGHGSPVKAIFFAFGANLSVAIIKSIAAFMTGSSSMLAEAIHSFADTGNQVLLLIGLKRSKLPATSEHPLGYGKASYFWSFMVAFKKNQPSGGSSERKISGDRPVLC